MMLREIRKQRDQTQSIIHVLKSIDKAWIAFSDHVTKSVLGRFFLQVFGLPKQFQALHLLIFFQVCLDVSEFLQENIVLKDFEVLDVEVCFVTALKLLLWFARIHTFENAQSSKILERQL